MFVVLEMRNDLRILNEHVFYKYGADLMLFLLRQALLPRFVLALANKPCCTNDGSILVQKIDNLFHTGAQADEDHRPGVRTAFVWAFEVFA